MIQKTFFERLINKAAQPRPRVKKKVKLKIRVGFVSKHTHSRNTEDITRVEVIDHTKAVEGTKYGGRVYVKVQDPK